MARKHGCKEITEFFRLIEQLGFIVTSTRGGFKIIPPAHIPGRIYSTHGTPQCLKPMISDFKKMYDLDLKTHKHKKKSERV